MRGPAGFAARYGGEESVLLFPDTDIGAAIERVELIRPQLRYRWNHKIQKQTENEIMTEVSIFAGICGFTTLVRCEDQGGYQAELNIESECPNWQRVNEVLGGTVINVMGELFKDKKTGTLNSQVLEVSLSTIPHVSCPVISGVLKGLEVSVGLALPKDAEITFK